jgi:hypothetical protein
MKHSNAKKLVGRLLDNNPVKIRKGNHTGSISQATWDALCIVLFSYGFKSVSYETNNDGLLTIKADDFILSTSVVLF